MSIQEALATAPWSLMAPTGGASRAAVGRAEDRDEASRFDAAMRRAETQGARATDPVDPVQAIKMGRPEEQEFAASDIPNGDQFFGEDGLTFGDVLDIVNPLQHIPGVSTVYRAMTGDDMSQGARLAGGTLYGGPVGFAGALANNISEDLTGDDVGGAIMTAFSDESVGPALASTNATGPTPVGLATTSMDDAATVAAALAPAAASPNAAVSPRPIASSAPAQSPGNPFYASQPTGAPFAAIPPAGSSPIQVVAPVGARAATSQVAQAAQATQATAPANPATVAATGVPELSPQAAEILMRMSQQSTPPVTSQASMPAPAMASTITPPPPAPLASPANAPSTAPSTASATATVGTTQTASDTTAYIDPVPTEDLSNAMMQALAKYQDMKAGQ